MFLLDILKITHNTDNENICDLCGEKFANYKDLIGHVRHVHHHPIMKCHECGKEFIHEKDRLHHVREEHLQKVDHRTHKWEHTEKVTNPQSDVDEKMHNFGDNF
jgi:uncharacterized C2H2 Zn-finger protein